MIKLYTIFYENTLYAYKKLLFSFYQLYIQKTPPLVGGVSHETFYSNAI